jgi:hypothetical protein
MRDEYRVSPHGHQFKITDDDDDTIGVYNSEQEAEKEVAHIRKTSVCSQRQYCWYKTPLKRA